MQPAQESCSEGFEGGWHLSQDAPGGVHAPDCHPLYVDLQHGLVSDDDPNPGGSSLGSPLGS